MGYQGANQGPRHLRKENQGWKEREVSGVTKMAIGESVNMPEWVIDITIEMQTHMCHLKRGRCLRINQV